MLASVPYGLVLVRVRVRVHLELAIVQFSAATQPHFEKTFDLNPRRARAGAPALALASGRKSKAMDIPSSPCGKCCLTCGFDTQDRQLLSFTVRPKVVARPSTQE